jgi:hypothetical protein
MQALSVHAHCNPGDDAHRSSHQGTAPDHRSSGACPHCDHAQTAAVKTDNGAAAPAARQLVINVILPHIVTAENRGAMLRRPLAVVHSPPALALLRQKCVLLI